MGASLEDLLSNSPPAETQAPSPAPASASVAAPEAQASSDPAPALAPSEPSSQDAPVEASSDAPAEPQGDVSDGTGRTTDGLPPSPGAPRSDAEDPKSRAFLKKAQDETRKRQDLEKQLKESNDRFSALERRIADLTARLSQSATQARPQAPAQQRPAAQPGRGQPQRRPPPPNPDVDPGAAIRYQQQFFLSELQRRDQEAQELRLRERIEDSQEAARERYPDYDEMESIFADEADINQALYAEMYRQRNPAKFAYEMGRKLKAIKEVGDDPAAWRAKQEESFEARLAEERKKWEEETASRQSAPPAPAPSARPAAPRPAAPPSPPPSLAGAPSAAPRNPTTRFDGPTPLEKLLG